jgi:hypothetical protein
MTRHLSKDLLPAAEEEWIGADQERTGSQLIKARQRRVDFALRAGVQDVQFQPESTRCVLRLSYFCLSQRGIIRVNKFCKVTVLKILASYPDGFASLEDLKRDMAILATSGKEWSELTKRLAARVPDLEIFSQGLVERLEAGWRITQRGRSVLEMMERR